MNIKPPTIGPIFISDDDTDGNTIDHGDNDQAIPGLNQTNQTEVLDDKDGNTDGEQTMTVEEDIH